MSGNTDVTSSYIHAYGLGKEEKKIFLTRDYGYYYNSSYDTSFFLPVDVNRDTSDYCLVNTDLTIDTVQIVYQRKFITHRTCDYTFLIDKAGVSHVSGDINLDSTRFVSGMQYSPRQQTLIIKLK